MLGLDRQLLEPESAVFEVRDANRACPAARVWGTLGLRLSAGHWLFLFASRDSDVVHKSVRSLDVCPEAFCLGPSAAHQGSPLVRTRPVARVPRGLPAEGRLSLRGGSCKTALSPTHHTVQFIFLTVF